MGEVPAPTALAFMPDGRLLVTSKPGQVWVVDGEGQKAKAFDLQDPDGDGNESDGVLCNNEARGLLGVAVDPDFGRAGNNFVYLFHNYKKFGNCSLNQNDSPVNRVSRLVLEGYELNVSTPRQSKDGRT